MRKRYLINFNTSALFSKFHEGYEYTEVIEREETFIVCQSPDEIVRNSFLHIGSTLKGAIESARFILKKKYKIPVGLSPQHNIILIPCNMPDQTGKAWLVDSHIKDIMPKQTSQTIVEINHGHTLTVNMSMEKFQIKRQQAAFLHKALLENHKKLNAKMDFFYEKNKTIILVKDHEDLQWIQKLQENKDQEEGDS